MILKMQGLEGAWIQCVAHSFANELKMKKLQTRNQTRADW